MKSELRPKGKIVIGQNIKVSTTLWKAVMVLHLYTGNIKNDKQTIKSMSFIKCILN